MTASSGCFSPEVTTVADKQNCNLFYDIVIQKSNLFNSLNASSLVLTAKGWLYRRGAIRAFLWCQPVSNLSNSGTVRKSKFKACISYTARLSQTNTSTLLHLPSSKLKHRPSHTLGEHSLLAEFTPIQQYYYLHVTFINTLTARLLRKLSSSGLSVRKFRVRNEAQACNLSALEIEAGDLQVKASMSYIALVKKRRLLS